MEKQMAEEQKENQSRVEMELADAFKESSPHASPNGQYTVPWIDHSPTPLLTVSVIAFTCTNKKNASRLSEKSPDTFKESPPHASPNG
jgi:hypothetical protein